MSIAPDELIDEYLEYAVVGNSRQAVALALDLLDQGVPEELVISGLLAGAQREVGERWHDCTASVAEEHLATGAAESALHALAAAGPQDVLGGLVVVACAEGDWHAIAAHMFAEQLRARGVIVAYLGASTPVDHVASFLARHRPEALAVSCNLAIFFSGLSRLADAAHAQGIPVLAGGRALGTGRDRARLLGADDWASNIDDAMTTLQSWRDTDFRPDPNPIHADGTAIQLDASADRLADAAFDNLAMRFPAMAHYDDRQLARTREDLAFIVRFVAAAQLVDDHTVLTTFLEWLNTLLFTRGVPTQAIIAGLDSLQPHLESASEQAGTLGLTGAQYLKDHEGSRNI